MRNTPAAQRQRHYYLGLAIATAVYLASVVAANMMTDRWGLVPVTPGLEVTAGTYAAGFALVARDFVQRWATITWGARTGRLYAVAVIFVAGALSWATVGPALAAASTIAFLGAELVDLGVFTGAQQRWGFARAVLLSNVVAAPVDTVLFLHLAGFPVTWQSVLGQFIGKVLWATLVPLGVWAIIDRIRHPRRYVDGDTLYGAISRDLGA